MALFVCIIVKGVSGDGSSWLFSSALWSQAEPSPLACESLQYRLYKMRIDDQLATISSIQSGALPTADLSAAAADYLRRCGMSQDQIDQLVDLLTGE